MSSSCDFMVYLDALPDVTCIIGDVGFVCVHLKIIIAPPKNNMNVEQLQFNEDVSRIHQFVE